MKTVEELAKEYQEKNFPFMTGKGMAKDVQRTYIDSHTKAKEWISVEEELPEERKTILLKIDMCDDSKPIIVTGDFSNGRFYSDNERLTILLKYNSVKVTHWKYID